MRMQLEVSDSLEESRVKRESSKLFRLDQAIREAGTCREGYLCRKNREKRGEDRGRKTEHS